MRIKWARCELDFAWHAIDQDCDHPPDVLLAQCGHRLPMVQLWDEPYGTPCQACAAAQLARRSRTS